MNNKTKRNLRKVVAGGAMALVLTMLTPVVTALAVDSPVVFLSVEQPKE
jgi:hypothetical protein